MSNPLDFLDEVGPEPIKRPPPMRQRAAADEAISVAARKYAASSPMPQQPGGTWQRMPLLKRAMVITTFCWLGLMALLFLHTFAATQSLLAIFFAICVPTVPYFIVMITLLVLWFATHDTAD